MRQFANDFHELRKSLANCITSDQKVVIHCNEYIILFLISYFMSWTHNIAKINYRSLNSPMLFKTVFSDSAMWRHANVGYWHRDDSLRWRHNGCDSVSNHQPHNCLLNRLFRRRSKKTSKLHVTGLCAGNSPGTGEFSAQMASYAENVSIWWRHHVLCRLFLHAQIGIKAIFTSEKQLWISIPYHPVFTA